MCHTAIVRHTNRQQYNTDNHSPGAAMMAAHCSWLSLGEDARMG